VGDRNRFPIVAKFSVAAVYTLNYSIEKRSISLYLIEYIE